MSPAPNPTGELPPDRAQLERYFAILFKHADPAGYLSLRIFGGSGNKLLREEAVQLGAADRGDRIEAMARVAAGLEVVAPALAPPGCTFTNPHRARVIDLKEGVAIVVECDERPRASLAVLCAILGRPTMIVESGGRWSDPATGKEEPKLHCFWRLSRPTQTDAEHQDLRTARRLVCDLVGADASAVSIVHPLRAAGSVHRKSTPRLAQIVEENNVDIDLGDALVRLRAIPDTSFHRSPTRTVGRTPNPDKAADPEDVAAALAVVPNDGLPWDKWNEMGMAAWLATQGDWHTGFNSWEDWSEKCWKYKFGDAEERWHHYFCSPPTKIGAGTIFWHAQQAVPGWVKPSERFDVTKWFVEPAPASLFDIGPSAVGGALHIIDPTRYQGMPIPARRWLVKDWVPWGSVTGLYGEGGLGKTLIAQQLQTAAAVGRAWLGLETTRVRSLGVYCEDSEDELWRRQADIDRLYGCDFRDLGDARWLPRGTENNLLVAFGKDGSLEVTDFHKQIVDAARSHQAELTILDTASDVFAGNENDRGLVKRFVSQGLGSLAQAIGGSVLVLLHPSRAGIASGTGDSGSTAWNGAFRSRLSLEVPASEKGERPDPDARELVRKKANYAARGDIIALRWRDGVLVVDGLPADKSRPQRPCNDVFLDLLDRMTRLDRPVSDSSRAGNFAPKAFALQPDAERYQPADFQRAMERLFSAGLIRNEAYGRKADLRQRIIRTPGEAVT